MNSSAMSINSMSTTAPAQGSGSGATITAGRIPTHGSQRQEKKKFVIRTTTEKYRACEYLSELVVDEANPFEVDIMPAEAKRNLLQNAYLFGWLYRYASEKLTEAGIEVPLASGGSHPFTIPVLHGILAEHFLCYATILDPITGAEKKLCHSTTALLKTAKRDDHERWSRSFPYYVEGIKEFVRSVWGIDIPPTYNADYQSLERELMRR